MVSNSQEEHLPSMPSSIWIRTIIQMHRAKRLSEILPEIARVKVFKLSSFYYFRFFPRNADLSTNVYKTVITKTQVDDPLICYFSVIYFCDYDIK